MTNQTYSRFDIANHRGCSKNKQKKTQLLVVVEFLCALLLDFEKKK
jgi:hypothetical protein